jgi:LysR family transcriptional activator of dmlA
MRAASWARSTTGAAAHARKATPKGLLRVNATLGFGRSHVAPLISRFVRKYPQVEVQLQLSVNPPPLTDDAFDVCIRFGEPPDARVIARRLAPNRRLLCAAPAYLARHGTPQGAARPGAPPASASARATRPTACGG